MEALKTKVTNIIFITLMLVIFHAVNLWDKDFGAHE